MKSRLTQNLYDKFVGGDPKKTEEYEQVVLEADIAQQIYDLRTDAGLTQEQLAKKIGTSASAISRLEDADYEGHSMAMLRRIADAFDRDVQVRMVQRPSEARI